MLHGTKLTRQNIHIIASKINVSAEELEVKRVKAKLDYQDIKSSKSKVIPEMAKEKILSTHKALPNLKDKINLRSVK